MQSNKVPNTLPGLLVGQCAFTRREGRDTQGAKESGMEEQGIYEANTELTPMQEAMLEIVEKHIGEDQRILKPAIVAELAAMGIHACERDLHQAVADLRETGYPVLASRQGGYYWPGTAEDVHEFIRREISGRAAHLHKQQAAIMRNLAVWFGQMGA